MATTQEWIDELKGISVLELAERIKSARGGVRRLRGGRRGGRSGRRRRCRRRRRRRGRGGVLDRRRRPHRRRRQEDPGHQGRPRGDRPRPQGGQGARRRGPQAGQGGHRARGGRQAQGGARGGRRHRRAEVASRHVSRAWGVLAGSRTKYATPLRPCQARRSAPPDSFSPALPKGRLFAGPSSFSPPPWPKSPLAGTIRRSADSRSRPPGRSPRHIRRLPGRGP